MLIEKIKKEASKLEEKKRKEDKLPIDFKESFKVIINSGDKNGSIQNT